MATPLDAINAALTETAKKAAEAAAAYRALGGAASGLKLKDITAAIKEVEKAEKAAAAETTRVARETSRELERLARDEARVAKEKAAEILRIRRENAREEEREEKERARAASAAAKERTRDLKAANKDAIAAYREAEKERAALVNAAFAAGARGADILRAPFAALGSAMGALQNSVIGFVAKANPAAVLRFNLALADTQAVIGRALVPVLNQFTALVRGIGNALAGLSANGQTLVASIAAGTVGLVAFGAAALAVQTIMTGGLLPVFTAIAGAVGGLAFTSADLGSALKGIGSVFVAVMDQVGGMLVDVFTPILTVVGAVIRELAPLIPPFAAMLFQLSPIGMALNMFNSAVDTIAPYLIAGAKLVTEFGRTVYGVMRDLLAYIGIALPEFNAAGRGTTGNSTGAAVRSTSTQDVSSVLQKARESAYMMGTGAKDDPAKRTANGMDTLNQKAGDIEKEIKRFLDEFPKRVAAELAAVIEKVTNALPEGARNAVTSVANAAATPGGRAATYAISPGLGIAMDSIRALREKFGN